MPSNARKNIVQNQNKQIELTAKLAGIDPTSIPGFPILDFQATQFTNPFGEIIDSLLPQVTPSDTTTTGDTTNVNLEEFSNNFDNKFDTIAATLAGLTATINTIDLNTNPTNLSTTVSNAVCSTTAPGGCTTKNVNNPLSQGQQGISNKLNDIASTLSAAFGAGNAALNAQILSVTTATNAIVAKGWASTAIDKTLNAANFALSLHNAMMLSTNIAETLLDVLTTVLDIGGVTDASGNPIDVGDWLKQKIEAVVKSLVGARNYTELSIKLTAANRIYQAGMNIIDNVTDLMDTAMDLDEYTGENISRIGNALRASGVVSFDAYEEMLEDLEDARKRSKWLTRLENIEDVTDKVYAIADNIRDIKETGQELLESREEFNTTISDTQALLKEQETELDKEIDSLSEPTTEDEVRG